MDALIQDPIIAVLLLILGQTLEENATLKTGLNLPHFSTDTTEYSRINAIKHTAGNSMTFQAPTSVSMLITRLNSMNDKTQQYPSHVIALFL